MLQEIKAKKKSCTNFPCANKTDSRKLNESWLFENISTRIQKGECVMCNVKPIPALDMGKYLAV